MAADLEALREQRLRQRQRLEIGPTQGLAGGATGAVNLGQLLQGQLQPGVAFGYLAPASACAADALGVARTARVSGIGLAHCRELAELADAGVDRALVPHLNF